MPLPGRLSGSHSLHYWVIVSLGLCGITIFHYLPPSVCVCVCAEASSEEEVEVEPVEGLQPSSWS